MEMPTIADRVLPGEESLKIVSRTVQWRLDISKIFNHKRSCTNTFKLAGCTWCLELDEKILRSGNRYAHSFDFGHPADTEKLPKSYILNLSVLDPANQPVQARFILRIAHGTMTWQSCPTIEENKQFEKGVCSFEHTLAEIQDKHLVIDFEFLEVNISHSNVTNDLAVKLFVVDDHPLNCLSRMFTESIYADVTINTKNGTLSAHKSVLAANSSVFACMFDNDFKENSSSTIDMLDMTYESCKAFFCYLYGALKEEDLLLHKYSLLEASHKYGIAKLQSICEERIIEDLNVSNVLERLSQAHLYELKKLKKECFEYLFGLGRVYAIIDDFSRFTLDADKGLEKEIILTILAKQH